MYDDFQNEIYSLGLIALLAGATGRYLQGRSYKWAVIVGIILGFLGLNSASLLYVGLGYVGFLLLYPTFSGMIVPRRHAVGMALVAGIAMVLVVLPWIARNQIQFGSSSLALRGGVVLLNRATKDQMSNQELLGAFYAFAPRYPQRWLGSVLGYDANDLKPGGRLQRLNRENEMSYAKAGVEAVYGDSPGDPISLRRQARSQRTKLIRTLAAEGVESPDAVADSMLQRKAIEQIVRNPLDHLRTTPLFLWRGMWSLDSKFLPSGVDFWVNTFGFLSLILLLAWGMLRRNVAAISFSLFPIGFISFYGLATHFMLRYSRPVAASMVIAAVVVVFLLGKAIYDRRKRVARNDEVNL